MIAFTIWNRLAGLCSKTLAALAAAARSALLLLCSCCCSKNGDESEQPPLEDKVHWKTLCAFQRLPTIMKAMVEEQLRKALSMPDMPDIGAPSPSPDGATADGGANPSAMPR